MSTPFLIKSFEEYLDTVCKELPKGRIYFRGQSKLVSDGYPLKSSIGRYKKLESVTLFKRDQMEREVLDVFNKQLFPDLDGIAKWLKYRVFEIDGKC